jgi:aldehyde dehydrogenase (NAD+)
MDGTNAATVVGRQRTHFASKATVPLARRIGALERLAGALRARERDLLRALKDDLGKSATEGYTSEIGYVLSHIRYAHRHIRRWSHAVRVSTPLVNQPGRSYHYPEPFGVSLIIGPWNYPLGLVCTPLVSALAAGNCAILKPSEHAPATAACVRKMIGDYFDPALVTVVTGGPAATQALINAGLDFIFYTGNSRTGRQVMGAASAHLTPVVLELGGKNPCIVDATASLHQAAERIAWGKFFNAGQTCLAPDFVCAHDTVIDGLQRELASTLTRFYGPDARQSPDYGRIVNATHVQRLRGLLAGHIPVHGGTIIAEERYVEPTLVRVDNWDDSLLQEEIFGPILPLIAYRHLDDALSRLSRMPSPLAVCCFSTNREVRSHVKRHTRSGTICFNGTLHAFLSSELPFGGVGESGMGRYHGKAGFDAFSYRRAVLEKHPALGATQMYPPYRNSLGFVRLMQRFFM